MRFAFLASTTLLALGLTAQSPLIYSNGPLITDPHVAGPGFFGSRLQSGAAPAGLGMNVLGFGAQQGAGNAIADDFVVWNAMAIDGIEIFGYLTGAIPAPPAPVTGVYVEISSTDPSVAITPVAGSPGLANNQFVNSTITFSNIYRVTTTTLGAVNRAVMSMKVNLPPIVLGPGTYWLIFQFTGVSFSPPVTVLGAGGDGVHLGNAKQRVGPAGAFAPMFDGGAPAYVTPAGVAAAFNLYGLSGNNPGSITNTLLPSCGGTTIRVGGAPVAGGFVQTDLTLSNPVGFPLIGYGFGAPLGGFCGCVIGHDWSSIVTGSVSNRLNIPLLLNVCGVTVSVQGAELLGVGGCAAPPLTFTDTYAVLINN